MKKIYITLFLTVLVGALAVLWFLPGTNTKAAPSTDRQIYGNAWSENVGWVSFSNCDYSVDPLNPSCSGVEYGVRVLPTTGYLDGYAWSENVGWIAFGSSYIGPSSVALNLKGQAKIDAMGKLSGWARVLSYQTDSGINNDKEAGEWADGWINLSGTTTNGSTYGVVFNNTANEATSSSYAWGGQVTGWISMNGSASDGSKYSVKITPSVAPVLTTLSITTGSSVTEINKTTKLTWSGVNITSPCVVLGITENNDNIYKNVNALMPASSDTTDPLGKLGKYMFTISCTDNDGKDVSASAYIEVLPKCDAPTVICKDKTNPEYMKCIPLPGECTLANYKSDVCGCDVIIKCEAPAVPCQKDNSCITNKCSPASLYNSNSCDCSGSVNNGKKVPKVKEN